MNDNRITVKAQRNIRSRLSRPRATRHIRENPGDNSQDEVKSEMIAESEEFVYEDESHAANILRGQEDLRVDKLLCDVTLCADGEEFPCHKTVLISSSAYFKAMFTGNMSEATQKTVVIKDVDNTTLKKLLEFVYTSKLVITASTVQSLLSAANLFQILSAKTACCQFMEKRLCVDNCYSIHRMADTFDCPDLYVKALDFIIANFSKLNTHPDFFALSSKELIEVISSDFLDVDNEEAVFDSITLWSHNIANECNKEFHKVLEYVRLPVLSPYFLCQRVEQFPAVKKCEKCRGLVDEAKRFHFLPDLRAEMRLEWTRFRKCHAFQSVIVSLKTNAAADMFGRQQNTCTIIMELFLVNDNDAVPTVTFGTTLKPLPKQSKMHGIISIESNLYLIGGESMNGTPISTVDTYNVGYDIWTELASMVVPRSQPGIALLYGNIYALGGRNGTEWKNSVEIYNPQRNTWEKGVDMPIVLHHITAVAFKGCIYAAGIPSSTTHLQEENKGVAVMLCYDSGTKSWSKLPPMPLPCYGSTAYITNNEVCLIGGKNIALESTRTVQSFNPEGKKWNILPSLIMPYYRPGVVVVNGLTFLGYDNSYPDKQGMFEYKDEKSNIWQMVVQDSKKDYVQWTKCVMLQIRKDTLDKHKITYKAQNDSRVIT